jgi:hypothetical protein
VDDLALVFLLVSSVSLVSQIAALTRLVISHAQSPAEKRISAGYLRTVACRVLAATIYVIVAGIQLAGDGTLSAEALIVFTSVQAIWVSNSVLDIRISRTLGRPRRGNVQR